MKGFLRRGGWWLLIAVLIVPATVCIVGIIVGVVLSEKWKARREEDAEFRAELKRRAASRCVR